MLHLTLWIFVHIFALVTCQEWKTGSPVVRLADGSPVKGKHVKLVTGNMVTEYLGVPFAEPPLGVLRFRPPVPKAPWSKIFNATELPKSCLQNIDSYFEPGTFQGADMWNANTPMDEDCLFLNVWVPERTKGQKPLAVMIWIFGGGFWSGTSTLSVYDGKILASEENVIIVSMNYRVSLFGFLYLGRPEAPGNVGLLDQVEALRWVRTNIASFGGDPEEVTLFGESAGAASVCLHAISPLSQPYFKRFILQSGSATAPWAMETKESLLERARLLAEALNCNVTKDEPNPNWTLITNCLMKKSGDELLAQEWQAFEFLDFPWTPVVDGYFLLEEPRTAIENGRFKKGQVLLGSNMDESIYFIVYYLHKVFKKEELFVKDDFLTSDGLFEDSAYALLPAYLKRNSVVKNAILFEYKDWDLPTSPRKRQVALDRLLGDYYFTCNVNEFAQRYEHFGGSVYSYYFAHRSTVQTWPAWMGVLHGYEINFIFGEPLNTAEYRYTNEERILSRRFMRYWANFARTGNPNRNPDGTWTADQWPMYTKNQEYLTISVNNSKIGHGPRARQCAFWKQYIPRLLTATTDLTDVELRWKQQFAKWEEEYIVDWKHQFEQYQKLQRYRYYDNQCDTDEHR